MTTAVTITAILAAGRGRIEALARETGCTKAVEDRVAAEILRDGGLMGPSATRFRAGDMAVIDEAWARLMWAAFSSAGPSA